VRIPEFRPPCVGIGALGSTSVLGLLGYGISAEVCSAANLMATTDYLKNAKAEVRCGEWMPPGPGPGEPGGAALGRGRRSTGGRGSPTG